MGIALGIVLDSSVLIAVERTGLNAHEALSQIAGRARGEDLTISIISVVELAHGVARSNTPERRSLRLRFVTEIIAALPVQPISTEIAIRAGILDGEATSRGVRIALSDLLIGVTALELGFKVATGNLKHFQMIPGLQIVSL